MFHRDYFDGPTKGNGVGGILSKGYEAWSEFQKDKVWFRKYQRFQKKEIKRLGKQNVYDCLKDTKLAEYKSLLQWIADEEVLLVKRGDYKQSKVFKILCLTSDRPLQIVRFSNIFFVFPSLILCH